MSIYGKCEKQSKKKAFKMRLNLAGGETLGVGGVQRLDRLHKREQGERAQSARGNMLKRRRINKQFQEQRGSAEAQGLSYTVPRHV